MVDTSTSVTKTEVKNFTTAVRKKADELNAAKFVAQESGKSLVSDTEIARLAGMETGAQVNIVEGISIVGGAAVDIDSSTKVAKLDLSDYAKLTDIASAYKIKGSKDTFADLPSSGNLNGDVWNIKIAGGTDRFGTAIKAGDNVVYVEDTINPTDSGWDVLGGTTDLSGYVEVEAGKGLSTNDFTAAYKDALDTLISGSDFTFTAQDVLDVFDDTPTVSGGGD